VEEKSGECPPQKKGKKNKIKDAKEHGRFWKAGPVPKKVHGHKEKANGKKKGNSWEKKRFLDH